ncbi:unnamed protein product, partial [Polarella glacialis]
MMDLVDGWEQGLGRPLYSDYRHLPFASGSQSPSARIASRLERAQLRVPDFKPSSGKVKSSQAIVVLCSHGVTTEGRQVVAAGTGDERWCSWADAKPVPREKLVEEQLERTHREYSRLFQHHGGAPKAPGQGAPSPTCRACFDPSAEHLLAAVAATRRLTSASGRVVFHYMHHRADSSAGGHEEGRLLLHCQDTNVEKPLPLHSVHEQLRSPAIYVFDCPHAGRLVRALNGMLPPSED